MQDESENDRAGAQAKEVTPRRLVKLVEEETMWLVANGVRRPITNVEKAVALDLPPEVIEEDELNGYAEGEPY